MFRLYVNKPCVIDAFNFLDPSSWTRTIILITILSCVIDVNVTEYISNSQRFSSVLLEFYKEVCICMYFPVYSQSRSCSIASCFCVPECVFGMQFLLPLFISPSKEQRPIISRARGSWIAGLAQKPARAVPTCSER